jgi:hypothetical protein
VIRSERRGRGGLLLDFLPILLASLQHLRQELSVMLPDQSACELCQVRLQGEDETITMGPNRPAQGLLLVFWQGLGREGAE